MDVNVDRAGNLPVARYTFGARSETNAPYREHNEDAFVVAPEVGLLVVCDGMGGAAAGEVASSTAARTIKDRVVKRLTPEHTPFERLLVLEEAFLDANALVYLMSKRNPRLRGMGTTASALLVGARSVVWAHVGDSRIYRKWDRGALRQLTVDHNLAQELGGSEKKPKLGANILTRAIGTHADVRVDTGMEHVVRGNAFALCTDGVDLNPNTVAEALERHPRRAAFALVEEAIARGSTDNCTAVVVRADRTVGAGEWRMNAGGAR
jgi:protein phosphatase